MRLRTRLTEYIWAISEWSMCAPASACVQLASLCLFSDLSSCWRPQGNNTQTLWGLCFHSCTVLPWLPLRGKRYLCTCLLARAELRITSVGVCKVQPGVRRFRCQGCLSWDGRLGLHDCFKQRGYRGHASRPRAGKAVKKLHSSCCVRRTHLKL